MIFKKIMTAIRDEFNVDVAEPMSSIDFAETTQGKFLSNSYVCNSPSCISNVLDTYTNPVQIVKIWAGDKYCLPYSIRRQFHNKEIVTRKSAKLQSIASSSFDKLVSIGQLISQIKSLAKVNPPKYSFDKFKILIPYFHKGEQISDENLKFCLFEISEYDTVFSIFSQHNLIFYENPLTVQNEGPTYALDSRKMKLTEDFLEYFFRNKKDFVLGRKYGPSISQVREILVNDHFFKGQLQAYIDASVTIKDVIKTRYGMSRQEHLKVKGTQTYPVRINGNIRYHFLKNKMKFLEPLWRKMYYRPENDILRVGFEAPGYFSSFMMIRSETFEKVYDQHLTSVKILENMGVNLWDMSEEDQFILDLHFNNSSG